MRIYPLALSSGGGKAFSYLLATTVTQHRGPTKDAIVAVSKQKEFNLSNSISHGFCLSLVTPEKATHHCLH